MRNDIITKIAKRIEVLDLGWSVEEAIQEMRNDKDMFSDMSQAFELDFDEENCILFEDELSGEDMLWAMEDCLISIIEGFCEINERILRKCMYISNNFDTEEMGEEFDEMQIALGEAYRYMCDEEAIEAYNSVNVAYYYFEELMWN